MTKVSRITLVMNTTQARIVRTAIEWLAVYLCFVTCNTGRDLATINCDCLCNTVLTLYNIVVAKNNVSV